MAKPSSGSQTLPVSTALFFAIWRAENVTLWRHHHVVEILREHRRGEKGDGQSRTRSALCPQTDGAFANMRGSNSAMCKKSEARISRGADPSDRIVKSIPARPRSSTRSCDRLGDKFRH